MKVDVERLRELFADPALDWVLDRVRRRLESGRGLAGTISLREPSPAERRAVDRLLGRSPTRGGTLTVRLAELEEILRHGELGPDLRSAVEALDGAPVIDRRAARDALDARWRALFDELAGNVERSEVRAWLGERRTWNLARRFSDRDPEQGRELLAEALAVIRWLPARGVPLARLAAELTGDSHALDAGQPLGTLVVSAASRLGRAGDWHGAVARRDVWAGVGVLLDELSAPVLTLNLRGDDRTLAGRVLGLHAEAGEPCRLSVRQLLRDPVTFQPMPRVFVCENPAVVAVAADRLGAESAPLVCLEGQPKTASRLLLGQLEAAGARLAYHGDFDWGGVRIANLVFSDHGAEPWRFRAADYRRTSGGKQLAGRQVEAVWDPDLARVMVSAGRAVHEEQVIDDLLADLAG